MLGLHGRRHPGPGETFWQFRPYVPGEPARQIDWRRSARDDHLYVREREWEASQTVWLWVDLSPSMDFRSRLSETTKLDRAVILMLALAEHARARRRARRHAGACRAAHRARRRRPARARCWRTPR